MLRTVKKYLFLARQRVGRAIEVANRSARASSYDIMREPYLYDRLDLLPFPTKWERLMSFKKLFVEIGSGHGELLEKLASEQLESLFIGFEWTKEFARRSIKRTEHLKNVRVYSGDAYRDLEYLFEKCSVDGMYLLFPDPWHKKKHNKRRPINSSFFMKAAQILKPGAKILVATDWMDYYDFIMNQTRKPEVQKSYVISTGDYLPEKFDLPATHYYKKWLSLGKKEFKFILLEFRGRP